MFNVPLLTVIKLGAVGIVAIAIGFHFYSDWSTNNELKEVSTELITKKEAFKVLEGDFIKATTDLGVLQAKIKTADAERTKIQLDLSTALAKLRGQKAPKECKAAIDWSVLNKADLSW